MKFKVGDKVKVRSWDAMEEEFGLDDGNINNTYYCFTEGMTKYCGNYVTIDSCSDDCYTIKEDNHNWSWTDDMFEEKEDKLFGVEVVYNVNEDKRTVACYFKTTEPQDSIWFDILDNMLDTLNSPVDKLYSPHMMFMAIDEYPNKYGLAKCLPEDTFDIEFGKRMARNQLRDRINRCKINFLDKYRDKYIHIKNQYENREATLYNKLVESTDAYSKSLLK